MARFLSVRGLETFNLGYQPGLKKSQIPAQGDLFMLPFSVFSDHLL